MGIERKQFLEMCQKISYIKNEIPNDLKVVVDGVSYYPLAYQLSFWQGKAIHTAILHDIKANSITHADLGKVDKFKK